jgi:hypothetical protein
MSDLVAIHQHRLLGEGRGDAPTELGRDRSRGGGGRPRLLHQRCERRVRRNRLPLYQCGVRSSGPQWLSALRREQRSAIISASTIHAVPKSRSSERADILLRAFLAIMRDVRGPAFDQLSPSVDAVLAEALVPAGQGGGMSDSVENLVAYCREINRVCPLPQLCHWHRLLLRPRRKRPRPRASAMAVQIVMDHTGDTRHEFDPADAHAVAEAEKRFEELTGAGFTAAKRLGEGKSEVGALIRRPRRRCLSRGSEVVSDGVAGYLSTSRLMRPTVSFASIGLIISPHTKSSQRDHYTHSRADESSIPCKECSQSHCFLHIGTFSYRPALTGISFCCACATSGHAAALPSPVMNSRRRIRHLPSREQRQPTFGAIVGEPGRRPCQQRSSPRLSRKIKMSYKYEKTQADQ